MKKITHVSLILILFASTILFIWAFISRAMMPYNSEGNYFDSVTSIVYHKQAVMIYGFIASIFTLCSVWVIYLLRKKQ